MKKEIALLAKSGGGSPFKEKPELAPLGTGGLRLRTKK